jgi:hypothetical protein
LSVARSIGVSKFSINYNIFIFIVGDPRQGELLEGREEVAKPSFGGRGSSE